MLKIKVEKQNIQNTIKENIVSTSLEKEVKDILSRCRKQIDYLRNH